MKNLKYQHLLILSLIIFLLTNCSIEKRHYLEGKHITWNKKSPCISKNIESEIYTETKSEVQKSVLPLKKEVTSELVASIDKGLLGLNTNYLPVTTDSCGDIIIMQDGKEINAKVFEINKESIKYKPCDNLDGPLYVVNSEKVFMIKYKNGIKEVIKKETKKIEPEQANEINDIQEKKNHPLALFSFITSFFSFIIFLLPVAIVTGIIAIYKISKYPEKYKGMTFAILGIVIGIAIIISLMFLL